MYSIYLMLAIGIPVFLIFGGALLAWSWSSDETQPEEQPIKAPHRVFFAPVGWTTERNDERVDAIVASIEDHLRKEREAAADYANNLQDTLAAD